MTRRYFVPDLPVDGGCIELPEAEAQHATRVMRVQTGETITLFDGKGHETEAEVIQAGRRECLVQTGPALLVDREPTREVHLGVALPKPDRARELIERLTELGVRSLTPLVAERTQRPPAEKLITKLQRGVIEACKQSGRNRLLEIHAPTGAHEFFAGDNPGKRGIADLVAPGDQATSECVAKLRSAGTVTIAVGPEGGWTDAERQYARDHGYEPIYLGERIYRIETAATVIAALIVTP